MNHLELLVEMKNEAEKTANAFVKHYQDETDILFTISALAARQAVICDILLHILQKDMK